MDTEALRIAQESSESAAHDDNNGVLVDHFSLPSTCALCQRIVSTVNEVDSDLEAVCICGDCNFLFLEDGTPQYDYRRLPRGRRTGSNSPVSIENLFSQQFSHIMNLVRNNQSASYEHEDPAIYGDDYVLLLQSSSSRATSSSRGWQRVSSDTESDGFDNVDSMHWGSESNVSFSRHLIFHTESDAISFITYGGDSDASVDGQSFLDTDMFILPDAGSQFESDTDIDPMHAGLDQWNSDDLDEEEGGEEDDNGELEESDDEENAIESTEETALLQNIISPSPSERSGPGNRHQQFNYSEYEGVPRHRIRGGRHVYSSNAFANLADEDLQHYIMNSGNYLHARGFVELLEHLADSDSLRRGSPPAALSSVSSLPHVVINDEHLKHDHLACAICKELLHIATEAIKLPCGHLYHASCILPWLSARNSCPLCRHELPTDDKDYEEAKRNSINRLEMQDLQQQDVRADADVEAEELHRGIREHTGLIGVDSSFNNSGRSGGRGRWFFLTAAPLVSLGIVLIMWLGNPLTERRGSEGHDNFPVQGQHQIRVSGSSIPNQRENRSRRWYFF